MAARTTLDLMSGREREQVRRLIKRLEELLRDARCSEFMTQDQRAELLSITGKLAPIFDKRDNRKRS